MREKVHIRSSGGKWATNKAKAWVKALLSGNAYLSFTVGDNGA